MEMTVSNYCEEANDRKNHCDPQQIEEESAQFSNPVLSNVQPSAELVDEISHKTVEKNNSSEDGCSTKVGGSKFINRDSIKVTRKRFTTSSSLNYGYGESSSGPGVHTSHLLERPEEVNDPNESSPFPESAGQAGNGSNHIGGTVHIVDDEPVAKPFDPRKEPKRGILKKQRWNSSTGSSGGGGDGGISQSQETAEEGCDREANSPSN